MAFNGELALEEATDLT